MTACHQSLYRFIAAVSTPLRWCFEGWFTIFTPYRFLVDTDTMLILGFWMGALGRDWNGHGFLLPMAMRGGYFGPTTSAAASALFCVGSLTYCQT